MIKQFFGKTFWSALAVIGAFWVLAPIGYYTEFSPWLLLAVGICAFVMSVMRLEYGVYLALIELVSNPHGQLLSTQLGDFQLSLRMTIFLAVMMAWLAGVGVKKIKLDLNDKRLALFAPLAAAIVIGFLIGVAENGFGAAFSDGNAYLFLAYLLPVLAVNWNGERKKNLSEILAAAAMYISMLSFLLLYAFSHFNTGFLQYLYVFFRDLRVAEITNLGGGVYRIFSQSQFFVFPFMLLILAFLYSARERTVKMLPATSLAISAAVLGLSRSFLVGFAGALLFSINKLVLTKNIRLFFRTIGQFAVAGSVGVVLIAVIALFPFPQQSITGTDLASAFADRAGSDDVAVSSRWNLLDPMIASIKSHPFEGSGFGEAVTFTSDDPRVREIHPDGTWSTVSMEWGWFELWIKMGILGPLGFLILLIGSIKQLMTSYAGDQSWLAHGLSLSLLFLAATHFFSPYLNHPIGLGFILFCVAFIPNTQRVKQEVPTKKAKMLLQQKQVAAATLQTD